MNIDNEFFKVVGGATTIFGFVTLVFVLAQPSQEEISCKLMGGDSYSETWISREFGEITKPTCVLEFLARPWQARNIV